MLRLFSHLACFAGALSVACGAAEPFPSLPSDQRVIDEQVWVPFTQAILRHDLEGYFAVHSPEVIRAEGRARRVSGLAAYRSAMESSWSRPPASDEQFELRFTLRLSNGGSAFETGYYRSVFRRANGEQATSFGAFAVTLRKEDERWKILVDADGFDNQPTTELMFQAAQPLTTVPRRGPYLGQRLPGTRAEIFAPGLISASGRKEGGVSFSPDGSTLYFTLITPDGRFATHVAREDDDGWSDSELADFAREGNTGDAFVAPDGARLYFASSRPPGTPPWNHRIWAADRAGDAWGTPRLLELGIDTDHGVHFPTISRDGVLYVGSNAEKTSLPNLGKSDIYFADTKRTPLVVQSVGAPINSPHEEWDPFIAPDGSYLLFQSDRPGGVGNVDLWVGFRQPDGTWGEPRNLGSDVNSPGVDVQARVTPDGRFIFFERPSRTEQDIWWVSAEVITRLRPPATPSADASTTRTPGINSLGMRFVSVPGIAARFSVWETRVRDFAVFMDASGHVSTGDVYSLDPADHQWKVHPTNSWQSPGFPQTPDHPVVNVSWNDANAFCRWLTVHEQAAGTISVAQEYRLPTDAEWSAAAGPSRFPWGNQWPPPARAGNFWGTEHGNSPRTILEGYDDGEFFVAAVGTFPPNAHGLYDLSGNVWEWCSDHYRKELNPADILEETPALANDRGGTVYRVMRGGGWVDATPRHFRNDARGFGQPFNRYCTGFRIVLAPVATTSPE